MSEQNNKLTSLVARKQLLLAESEINRVQLLSECSQLSAQIDDLAEKASSALGAASSLFAGYQYIRDILPGSSSNGEGQSWTSKISGLFRAGTALWSRFTNKAE